MKGFSIFKRVILVAILIGLTSRSSAQTFLGLKAGANATRISFDNEVYKKFYDTSFKPGFTVGGVFFIENKERYGLNVEFLYSVKGKSVDSRANDYMSNTANYHYLDFPILFRIKFNESNVKWFLQLGPEVSYWLSGKGKFKVYEPDRDAITTYDYTINFGEPISSSEYLNVGAEANRVQLGLAVGGGFTWKLDRGNYLSLDLRYTFGHTFTGSFEGASIPNIGLVDNLEHTNNVASISVVYYVDILEKLRLSKNKYQRK